jgi:hypothetical protein
MSAHAFAGGATIIGIEGLSSGGGAVFNCTGTPADIMNCFDAHTTRTPMTPQQVAQAQAQMKAAMKAQMGPNGIPRRQQDWSRDTRFQTIVNGVTLPIGAYPSPPAGAVFVPAVGYTSNAPSPAANDPTTQQAQADPTSRDPAAVPPSPTPSDSPTTQ